MESDLDRVKTRHGPVNPEEPYGRWKCQDDVQTPNRYEFEIHSLLQLGIAELEAEVTRLREQAERRGALLREWLDEHARITDELYGEGCFDLPDRTRAALGEEPA